MATIAVVGLGAYLGSGAGAVAAGFIAAATAAAAVGAAYVDQKYVYPLFGNDDNAPPDRAVDQQLVRSKEGAPLPIVFGSKNRVPCNVAWVSNIRERESAVNQGGGKGGGSQTIFVKSYLQDGLVVAAEGPGLGYQRVWANGDVLYDADLASLIVGGPTFFWPPASPVGSGLIYQIVPGGVNVALAQYAWVVRTNDPSLTSRMIPGMRMVMSGISGGTYDVSAGGGILPIQWDEEFEVVRVEGSDVEFISAEPFNLIHRGLLGRIVDPQNIVVSAGFQMISTGLTYDRTKVGQMFFGFGQSRDNPSGPGRNVKYPPMVAQEGSDRTPPYQGIVTIGLEDLNRNEFFNTFPLALEAQTTGPAFNVRTTMASIMSDYGKVPSSFYDLSGVTQTSLPGYAIQSPRTVLDALRPLLIYYDILTQQDGARTKFFQRSNAEIIDVPEEDLGAYDSGNVPSEAPAVFSRNGTLRVVSQLTVAFIDEDRELERGTVKANWHIGESGDQEAVQTIELPLAGRRKEFKQFAWRALRDAHRSVQRGAVDLPPSYEYVAENDILRFTFAGKTRLILVQQIDQTETGLIRFEGAEQIEGLADVPIEFNNDAPIQRQRSISIPRSISSLLIDVPALRRNDHLRAGVYAAFSDRSGGRFQGAAVYESPDVTPRFFEQSYITDQEDVFGVCTTTLGTATESMLGVWDRTSDVTVELFNGELSSYGEDAASQGLEYAVVGGEVIRFANVELISENTYRLYNLVRGLRDTEDVALAGHSADEAFMLVRSGSGQFIEFDATTAPRVWKIATPGYDLALTRETTIQPSLATLRPFSVAHLTVTGAVASDISVTWSPRRRGIVPTFQTGGIDSGDESVEQYRVTVRRPGESDAEPIFDETVTVREFTLDASQQSGKGVVDGELEFTVVQLGDHGNSKPQSVVL